MRLSDEQGREDLKQRLGALRSALQARDALQAKRQFDSLDADIHEISSQDQLSLLGKVLAWDETDHRLAGHVHSLYARLGEAARGLALVCEGTDRLEALAAAIDYWAQAAKWEVIACGPEAPQRFEKLHGAYLHALESPAGAEHKRRLMANGAWVKLPIDGLYVRALMLRRLCGGQLGPRQIEILDSWLLSWIGDMKMVERDPTPEARLLVQPDSHAGLALVPNSRFNDPLYLALAPFKEQLDRTFESLQQGELFPGHGASTTFRLEEHVALLDVLHREFTQAGFTAAPRDTRTGVKDFEVEVYPGLGEIFRNGFAPTQGDAPEEKVTPFEPMLERRARRLRLRDHNESGLGLTAGREDALAFNPGDLMGVRLDPNAPCVLCEVARKVASTDMSGDWLLGMRVISRDALPLRLVGERAPAASPDVEALYVPGTDSSGRADSLIVSEAVFAASPILVKEDDGEKFRFKLNRGRRRGRGWVMAGIEFLAEEQSGVPRAAPAASKDADGPLTLSLAE